MTFRTRLVLFLVVSLAVLQIGTALLVYEVTRRQMIGEGERQLGLAATAFTRQLDDVSARVADNVQVLTLDYALRSAIAQRDRDTVLSALRNHGRRIGASRMLLVGLQGDIEADTQPGGSAIERFPFPDLTDQALDHPAAAVVALDERAYWMVVVPVYAPALIGLIAASIPIDDAFLQRLQEQSTLPNTIELAVANGAGKWSAVAHGSDSRLAAPLIAAHGAWPLHPSLVTAGGREYVAAATPLQSSRQSRAIVAVLGYSLDDALRPYRSVAVAWTGLLALGLVLGLIGSLLIARGVSRPIEALAAMARRIAAGDYATPASVPQGGEVGELAAAFAAMTDAIREREEQLRFQSGHDATTMLPNRRAAEAAIDQQLAGLPAGALLLVTLARLPETTKTLGHAISDRLMRDAGARIRAPAGDALVARAGDSAFAVWLPGADAGPAIALAFRLVDLLGEPYREADVAIDLAPAVGIALHPQHGDGASALLQHAEVALFAALGSAEPVVVYDPAVDPHRPERLSLMADLRAAIDHDELQLHYQPKWNLGARTFDGVEGLLRWRHPRRGVVMPDAFIPLAEETGNIRRVTRWVLAAGIAQASQWSRAGRPLRVALNLSARDLDDGDLPRRMDELLSVHGVMPERIVLEITESAVMGNPEAAIRVLRQLADRGIDLALDDFGVGQSSFAYLRRLPVRELKIDKSFLLRLAMAREDRAIVGSIAELGRRLGFRVTAEGVTDRATLDYLAQIGCDHAQGYFIARPMPVDALDVFLAAPAAWIGESIA